MSITAEPQTGLDNVNAAIGSTANQYMFETRVTRTAMASLLGVTGSQMSKKLLGKTAWSAKDVALAAALLGLESADLMPDISIGADGTVSWIPAPYIPGKAKSPVPGNGGSSEPPERIELSTYSLRVNRSAD